MLGIAQDGGVPHVGCREACCVAARARGVRVAASCLGIRDPVTGARVLVEATPDIETQLARLGSGTGGRNPVDAVLLTHAHVGHYLGLAHFGREVAHTHELPVHVTRRFAGFLAANAPWSQLVALGEIRLCVFEPGQPFEPVPGLRVTGLHVVHREDHTDCVAFRIAGPAHTVLFCPDIDGWDRDPGFLERALDGVDAAYLDGTFHDGSELPGVDPGSVPHPLMTDTMERLAGFAAAHPGVIRFIHLNHSNRVLRDGALRAEIAAWGFGLAAEGERVPL